MPSLPLQVGRVGQGHYLCTLEGSGANDHATINNVRSMSEEEVRSYTTATDNLNRWVQIPDEAFRLLSYAYQDLTGTIDRERSSSMSQAIPDGREQLIRINSDLLSYLSMARMYVDQVKTTISSEETDALDAFNHFCSGAYDSVFAYRLFENVRNFGQHNGVPLTGLHASGTLSRESRSIAYSFELYFDRDHLISPKFHKTWQAPVRDELTQLQSNELEAESLIESHFAAMNQIHELALGSFKNKISDDFSFLNGLWNETKVLSGRAVVATLDPNQIQNSRGDVGFRFVPTRTLEIINAI